MRSRAKDGLVTILTSLAQQLDSCIASPTIARCHTRMSIQVSMTSCVHSLSDYLLLLGMFGPCCAGLLRVGFRDIQQSLSATIEVVVLDSAKLCVLEAQG